MYMYAVHKDTVQLLGLYSDVEREIILSSKIRVQHYRNNVLFFSSLIVLKYYIIYIL